MHPEDDDAIDEEAPDTESRPVTNGDLARIFHEIGDILEVKGELVFKTVAYHRAADAIGRAPFDVAQAYRKGNAPKIPGVGQAISDKITELVTTGRMPFHERLKAEIPATLVELLRIPGRGRRTVRKIYEGLGIETIEDLRQAAEAGTLRTLRGLSQKTEATILEGIAALESRPTRLLIHKAQAIVDSLIEALEGTPGLRRIVPAGSLRRRKETIGDLDLLAETDDPATLMERFTTMGIVERVANRGGYRAAVQLMRGPDVDLMIMPPGQAGTHPLPLTGSEEHNRVLRAPAPGPGRGPSREGAPLNRGRGG